MNESFEIWKRLLEQECSGGFVDFCLAYSSTMKMETVGFSDTSESIKILWHLKPLLCNDREINNEYW
jgi:hypothetical protein